MSIRLSQLPMPLIRIVCLECDDLDWTVLGGIHLEVAYLFKVAANGTTTPITIPGVRGKGKNDSVALKRMPSGTLRVIISEALTKPDGTSDSGSTCLPVIYDVPNVFPPFVPPSAGVDAWARQQIAAHEARLDRGAAGLTG